MIHEAIKAALKYCPDSGVFTWNVKTRWYPAGAVAGSLGNNGYLYIYLKELKKAVLSHRLAWFYVYGEWPSKRLDHKDGNKLNNAISNLREVTAAENAQNRKNAGPRSKSGLLGAWFCKESGCWVSQIKANGKHVHLGRYASALEAHNAYMAAKRKLHPVAFDA